MNNNRIMDSKSSNTRKTEELSLQLTRSSIPEPQTLDLSRLKFDRLQLAEDEVNQSPRIEFGRFVAREAVLDEEYWVGHPLSCKSPMFYPNACLIVLTNNSFCRWLCYWFCDRQRHGCEQKVTGRIEEMKGTFYSNCLVISSI